MNRTQKFDLIGCGVGIMMAAGAAYTSMWAVAAGDPWPTAVVCALAAIAGMIQAYLSWRSYRVGTFQRSGPLWVAFRAVLWVAVLVQLVAQLWPGVYR
jgi:hypothetical protein